jgi:hypothetical protein
VVGILTFHIASGCWRWTRLSMPQYAHEPIALPFSLEGIVFSSYRMYKSTFSYYIDAYNHPNKKLLISDQSLAGKAFGMAVRTPHSFQFIISHPQLGTQIFDPATKLWERRPSLMPHVESCHTVYKACLHFGDEVFIWSLWRTILVYSLNKDVWSVLDTPPSPEPWASGALGAWHGRVFLFSCLSLWELIDRAKPTWRRFAHVPTDIHAWLVPPYFQGDNNDDNYEVRVYASFSQEHVLIHTLVCETSASAPERIRTKRSFLFNLATKKWEKEEMCAVESYPEKKNYGQWNASKYCFT